MAAWKAKNRYQRADLHMERNPYYVGVDKEGNQLPYIDEVAGQVLRGQGGVEPGRDRRRAGRAGTPHRPEELPGPQGRRAEVRQVQDLPLVQHRRRRGRHRLQPDLPGRPRADQDVVGPRNSARPSPTPSTGPRSRSPIFLGTGEPRHGHHQGGQPLVSRRRDRPQVHRVQSGSRPTRSWTTSATPSATPKATACCRAASASASSSRRCPPWAPTSPSPNWSSPT